MDNINDKELNMCDGISRIQSVLDLEKREQNCDRRKSLFENPNQTEAEKQEEIARLDDWNRRWGKHNLDYVNVIKYPEEYIHKIIEENNKWVNGLESLANWEQTLNEDLVVSEEALKPEQKSTLKIIDSRISKYTKDATDFLNKVRIYKRIQEARLEQIEVEKKNFEFPKML